jgi:ABC-type xylose transport system substrate-binding protein
MQSKHSIIHQNIRNLVLSRSWIQASLIIFVVACAILPIAQGALAGSVKIGFLLKTMQEERYRTDKHLFIARAESMGTTVIFNSSANDELIKSRNP